MLHVVKKTWTPTAVTPRADSQMSHLGVPGSSRSCRQSQTAAVPSPPGPPRPADAAPATRSTPLLTAPAVVWWRGGDQPCHFGERKTVAIHVCQCSNPWSKESCSIMSMYCFLLWNVDRSLTESLIRRIHSAAIFTG